MEHNYSPHVGHTAFCDKLSSDGGWALTGVSCAALTMRTLGLSYLHMSDSVNVKKYILKGSDDGV
jgi:hypothetical protein